LKIVKSPRGYRVRIPNEVVEKMNLKDKKKVDVFIDYENGFIIYKPF